MAEAYEVYLGGVPPKRLLSVLKYLELRSESADNISCSEDITFFGNRFTHDLVEAIIRLEGSICVSTTLHVFHLAGGTTLPLVLVRVIKSESGYDVELSFEEADIICANNIMFAMSKIANNLRGKFRINEVYGGMEPASDIETRFFTNDTPGPLSSSPPPDD